MVIIPIYHLQEQVAQARREEEKRERRIYGNWKKLIKGMLVRARVREDYKRESDEEDMEMQENPKSKRKITQADIDAQREEIRNVDAMQSLEETQPINITHPIRNLRIDLSSDVVEMAKKSRDRTMQTKNVVKKIGKKREVGKKKDVKEKNTGELEGISDDEVESDQEEKKEKIRAILNWGTTAVASNPDLSDDSETENEPQSSTKRPQELSSPLVSSIVKAKVKRVKKERGRVSSKINEGESDSLSSRSTTPEPETSTQNKSKLRRISSRRSVQKKPGTYMESEGEISLDSSDCDDRSYNPCKEKL